MKARIRSIVGLAVVLLGLQLAHGQEYGNRLGVTRGGKVSFEPQGSGVMFGALDPAVKKWYVPQELFFDYQWRQWEYSNYARNYYQRYVNIAREGSYFYDLYGKYITHGWLVYDWRQDQPQQSGSSIFKSSWFDSWFSSLTIGSDAKGQSAYAITVGNRIRTTLTPMTFSKPTFNGVQIDFMADKYAGTILASRISDPIVGQTVEPSTRTNLTTLFGGRATAQVGDFIEIGATLVDAQNSNTNLDLLSGDLIAGSLSAGQSSTPLTAIAVVLSDDSPEDNQGGAALFSHAVRIVSRNFETGAETVSSLQDVVRPGSTWPVVFGGFRKVGFLAADGPERIILNYDFTDPAYIGPDPTAILRVEFDYVLANDFKVDMWSSRQTGQRPMVTPPLTSDVIDASQPVLLTVKRAPGNVRDISNLQRIRFEYGLPTANLVGGFTVEGSNVWGFNFYGEWDRNKRYFQYPNAALFNQGKQHRISSQGADALLLNVSRQFYPWFVYGEWYSVDQAYSTTAYLIDVNGDVKYDDPQNALYEFVDDNDDQDQFPDWVRFGSVGDRATFPGWDENNDFVNDFNQNDNATVTNTLPDYEEPFLRYEVDRPEFLFGIDLNNNAWIDRFEDDDLPDYPYKPDRRGYNAFAGIHLTPEMRLTCGRTDERMPSGQRKNRTSYAMFTFDRDFAGLGRLRVFDMLKRAKDDIPDRRKAPTPYADAPLQPLVKDILPAQDTWINSAWVGFDYKGISRLNVSNKLKYEAYDQTKDDPRDAEGQPLNGASNLFGLINKVDYTYTIGRLELQPRFKSEWLRQGAFLRSEKDRRRWSGSSQLLTRLPVLRHTRLEAGVDLYLFRDLLTDEREMLAKGLTGETGDYSSTSVAFQLSNLSDYMGYRMTTQLGLRYGRLQTEMVREKAPGAFERFGEGSNETISFITVYAGIQ